MTEGTFIIDCPTCKAKVAAIEHGRAQRSVWDEFASEPWGHRLLLGSCPVCKTLLVGEANQTAFDGFEGEPYDQFADVVRVYPNPPKVFSSFRIPKLVLESLAEADRCVQASAYVAACAMLGRALEAICRDVLLPSDASGSKKKLMLAAGIKQLKERKFIDDRLYDWSQQLHGFRNLAAHPDVEFSVSRTDVEDLQAFVNAITEYIYDLADRYDEFKRRLEKQANRSTR